MKEQLDLHKIQFTFNWAQPVVIKEPEDRSREIARNTIKALKTCYTSHFKLCIIMEDDAKLHPNFIDEVSETWNSLPKSATLLHMCPGFAWGRKFRNETMHFHVNPEKNVEYPKVLSRYWNDWPCKHGFCATGSPVAFMVESRHVPLLIKKITLVEV